MLSGSDDEGSDEGSDKDHGFLDGDAPDDDGDDDPGFHYFLPDEEEDDKNDGSEDDGRFRSSHHLLPFWQFSCPRQRVWASSQPCIVGKNVSCCCCRFSKQESRKHNQPNGLGSIPRFDPYHETTSQDRETVTVLAEYCHGEGQYFGYYTFSIFNVCCVTSVS
jgi:hypothetical protein